MITRTGRLHLHSDILQKVSTEINGRLLGRKRADSSYISGQSVEIRCSKIISVLESDYIEQAVCDPSWTHSDDSKYCYHKWSKNGKEIKNKTRKYEITSSITVDYCDNFEWTTSIIQTIPYFRENHTNDRYYSSDMKCYTSILKIENVMDEDLGMYRCNFSYHKNNSDYYRDGFSMANTTLVSLGTDITPNVDYFQGFYTSGVDSMFLAQCVVSGSKEVYWFIDRECTRWDCYEARDVVPFDKLDSLDIWKTFNFSRENHSPHLDIAESIIFFQDISSADLIGLTCSPQKSPDIYSLKKLISIKMKDHYWDYYWYGRVEDGFISVGLTVICVVIGALFIATGILSCVRSKICTARNHRSPIMMAPQMTTQPITYVVPTVPNQNV